MAYARRNPRRALGALNTGPIFPGSAPMPGSLSYGQTSSLSFSWGSVQNVLNDASKIVSSITQIRNIANSFKGVVFSSHSTDDQRQARVNYFLNAALVGSVTAAQYILGGMANTGSHEIPMWSAASQAVQQQRPDVYSAALDRGKKWAAGIPDPQGTQSMVDDVERDLAAIGATVSSAAPTNFGGSSSGSTGTSGTTGTGGTTQHPVSLPPITTKAPFNYTPWLIGGAVGLALLTMRNR